MENKLTVIGVVAEWKMNSATSDMRSRGFISKMIELLDNNTAVVVTEFKEEAKKIGSTNMKRDFNNSLNVSANG